MVLARFPATAGEIGLLGEESLFLPARKRSQLEREVFHSRRRGDEAERGGGYRSPGRFVLLLRIAARCASVAVSVRVETPFRP